MRICLPLLFITIVLVAQSLAYPSAPGTCNVDKMAIVGHGPSQSTCEDCYGVQITPLSDRTAAPAVHIQITGRYAYQGVLFLVRNMATHKVVGEFFNFDENLFTSVACDDDEEPDFNEIDIDKYTVLGHIDPKLKEWPVHLDWMMTTDALNNSVTELELQGMVVLDYDNFHILPQTRFKIKQKIIKSTTTTAMPGKPSIEPTRATNGTNRTDPKTSNEPTQTIFETEYDPGTIVPQETNTLFVWVLSFFLCIYMMLSICYRLFEKQRRATKHQLHRTQSNTAASARRQTDDDDDIPLVSVS